MSRWHLIFIVWLAESIKICSWTLISPTRIAEIKPYTGEDLRVNLTKKFRSHFTQKSKLYCVNKMKSICRSIAFLTAFVRFTSKVTIVTGAVALYCNIFFFYMYRFRKGFESEPTLHSGINYAVLLLAAGHQFDSSFELRKVGAFD